MDSSIFIGAAIIAITELIKRGVPQVSGALTIFTAMLVGVLVAVVDQYIGVTDISIAEGFMVGLSSSGVVSAARAVGSTAPPKV